MIILSDRLTLRLDTEGTEFRRKRPKTEKKKKNQEENFSDLAHSIKLDYFSLRGCERDNSGFSEIL